MHVSLDSRLSAGRAVDVRRRLLVASLAAVFVIAAATSGAIWRYDVALSQADSALTARANALSAQQANTSFWRERESMNEYILHPSDGLLTELAANREEFRAATTSLASGGRLEASLAMLAERSNDSFIRVFLDGRHVTGGQPRDALVQELNDSEALVLVPLAELRDGYLGEVASRQAAKDSSDSQAVAAALLGSFIAIAATTVLAFYSRRLLGSVHARQLTEQEAARTQYEFVEMIQNAEAEDEADELLKRQLERSVAGSSVVILRRNNSDDRLLATSDPGPDLAERLLDAEPRSCLAVRFGRMHEEAAGAAPLIRCALCAREEGDSTCQPLLVGGEVLGATLVRHPASLSPSDRTALVAAVGQAGPVMANLRNLALARFRAATDALTGLPNSREVQDTVKRMVAHASRTMSPLAALMLDLDHFKQINDTFGHAAGDDVLAALGATLRATLRASDFVGRYGGEEFVILLPDTGREEAEAVAEKVRAAVAAITLAAVTHPITASIGLALVPDDANDSGTLLRDADRALYTAKANGRNRVVSSVPAVLSS